MAIKPIIREIIYGMLYYSGFLKLCAYFNRKNPIILYYHGVTAKKSHHGIENHQGKHLYVRKFIRQTKYLKRFYRVVPLATLMEEIQTGSIKPYTAAITFDDGYENNYINTFPVLKSFHLPATIFLTTGLIGKKDFLWVDEIEYLVDKTRKKEIVLELKGKEYQFDLGNRQERIIAEERIRSLGKQLPDKDRHALIMKLREECQVELKPPDGDYAFLSWDEVKEMRMDGVDFGAHGKSHSVLTHLTRDKAEDEIVSSRDKLDEELKEDVKIFCYPGGFFNAEVKEILKSCGFRYALTTMPGYNDSGTDPYELKRFGASANGSFPAFMASISGFSLFLERGLSQLGTGSFTGRSP